MLRRPPRPPLPPSAHDVLREARLLRALRDTPARVPEVLAVCTDEQVIGAPFYVMERIEGEVIVASVPAALDSPPLRREIAEELIDALVEIHAVDWQRVGLDGLRQADGLPGTPAAPLRRAVGASTRRARSPRSSASGRGSPSTCRSPGRPRSCTATTASATRSSRPMPPARLLAVLDWEMATIGDPLADLGYLCMMWTEGGDPRGGMREYLGGVTRARAFPRAAS